VSLHDIVTVSQDRLGRRIVRLNATRPDAASERCVRRESYVGSARDEGSVNAEPGPRFGAASDVLVGYALRIKIVAEQWAGYLRSTVTHPAVRSASRILSSEPTTMKLTRPPSPLRIGDAPGAAVQLRLRQGNDCGGGLLARIGGRGDPLHDDLVGAGHAFAGHLIEAEEKTAGGDTAAFRFRTYELTGNCRSRSFQPRASPSGPHGAAPEY
jgi:hypothetical protein